jgi:hypothetical protein
LDPKSWGALAEDVSASFVFVATFLIPHSVPKVEMIHLIKPTTFLRNPRKAAEVLAM